MADVFGDGASMTWWRKIWRGLQLALSAPTLPSRYATHQEELLADLRQIGERGDFIGRTCRKAAAEIEQLAKGDQP